MPIFKIQIEYKKLSQDKGNIYSEKAFVDRNIFK